MRGNAAMPVFLSDAIANGRLGQTLLYIKDFRKANQLFRIILKIDSCDKLFLFFKISLRKSSFSQGNSSNSSGMLFS